MNPSSENPPKEKKKRVKSLVISGATILCLSIALVAYLDMQEKAEARARLCKESFLRQGLTPLKDNPCMALSKENWPPDYSKNFW